jgi:hypothetical protein
MFEWSKPTNPQRRALCGGSIMPYLGLIEHASAVEDTGRWV